MKIVILIIWVFMILFFPQVYAEEDVQSQDIDYGIIVASITAAGLFGGFLINAFSNRANTKSDYLRSVNEYQEKFESAYQSESNLITKHDCEIYAIHFLNILDSMVFAASKKWIPYDVVNYFKTGECRYGKTLLEWWEEADHGSSSDDAWVEFSKWCKDNKDVEAFEKKFLPEQFNLFSSLPNINQQHYQKIRDDHQSQIRVLLNDQELLACFNQDEIPDTLEKDFDIDKLKPIERKIFNFFILEFDLYERVFLAKNSGIIDNEEWELWLEWFKIFKKNWIFRFTFERMAHVFESELMNSIGEAIFGLSTEEMKKLQKENRTKYA